MGAHSHDVPAERDDPADVLAGNNYPLQFPCATRDVSPIGPSDIYNPRMPSLGLRGLFLYPFLTPTPRRNLPLPVHTFDPCPATRKSTGLVILGPRGLHPDNIPPRRRTFLDI